MVDIEILRLSFATLRPTSSESIADREGSMMGCIAKVTAVRYRKVKKDIKIPKKTRKTRRGKTLCLKKMTLGPAGECERGQQWDMTLSLCTRECATSMASSCSSLIPSPVGALSDARFPRD